MSSTIYRTEDPDLETVEFGALYRIHPPRTGEPWTLYKVSDDCGVDSVHPLDTPDGWDDSFELTMGYGHGWARLSCLAMDAHHAHAALEAAFIPVVDDGRAIYPHALLHRFVRPN